jgi:hypothetical protein
MNSTWLLKKLLTLYKIKMEEAKLVPWPREVAPNAATYAGG